jgi:hypothetical protein
VDRHSHAERPGQAPGGSVQAALGIHRRGGRATGIRERELEGITNDLEDHAAKAFGYRMKNGVVLLVRDVHLRRRLLPEPRTPLNIGEQERNGSAR